MIAKDWPGFLGAIPDWLSVAIALASLAGGTFAGGYAAARARMRMADRRELRDRILPRLRQPGLTVAPFDSGWTDSRYQSLGSPPHTMFFAQMYMADLLSDAIAKFEVLGWRERAMWRQIVRGIPPDIGTFMLQAFVNRRGVMATGVVSVGMLNLDSYDITDNGQALEEWRNAIQQLNKLLLAQVRTGIGPRWVIMKTTWKLWWSPIELFRAMLIPWQWTDDEPFTRRHYRTLTEMLRAKSRRGQAWALRAIRELSRNERSDFEVSFRLWLRDLRQIFGFDNVRPERSCGIIVTWYGLTGDEHTFGESQEGTLWLSQRLNGQKSPGTPPLVATRPLQGATTVTRSRSQSG